MANESLLVLPLPEWEKDIRERERERNRMASGGGDLWWCPQDRQTLERKREKGGGIYHSSPLSSYPE